MLRIWKFTLSITEKQQIKMPSGAKLLSAQIQNNMPRLWYLCEDSNEMEFKTILTYGTGNPIRNHPGNFIDTFQMYDGNLVLHVFEE